MCFLVSDYLENYYIPLMKLSLDIPEIKNFIQNIKTSEEKKNTDFLIQSYDELVNYIKNNVDDPKYINLYFNRMRCDIQHHFSNNGMFSYVYF
jgi:hypothetical protein